MKLEQFKIIDDEKSGRTTRIINKTIQDYFNSRLFEPIEIYDHYYPLETLNERNKELLTKVINRLKREHGLIQDKDFIVDDSNSRICIIKILDNCSKIYENIYNQWKWSYGENHNLSYLTYFGGKRANGYSTRMADDYIERIFNTNDRVEIYDHYPERRAHEMLMHKIMRRLKEEHPDEEFYYGFHSAPCWIQRKTKEQIFNDILKDKEDGT